jgi:hypothetical protein
MKQNILILGAGELGLAIVDALAKHPLRSQANLAVLLRQSTLDSAAPEKKETVHHLKAMGADFEAADIVAAPVSELSSIFKRYDTVISCTGMTLPSGTQTKLTEAVLDAGVKRYIPWQFGMDYDVIGEGSSQDLFDEQLRVRKMLREQDKTKWTIVSVGLFMSFIFDPAFDIVNIAGKSVHGLGSWDTTITATTPEDIGRVVAEVVLHPRELAEHSGIVYAAGDTVSYGQLADLVEARFGASFKRVLWDWDMLKKEMADHPTSGRLKYWDTFAQGKGVAWPQERTINHERGIPMTDVKAYLQKMKSD